MTKEQYQRIEDGARDLASFIPKGDSFPLPCCFVDEFSAEHKLARQEWEIVFKGYYDEELFPR